MRHVTHIFFLSRHAIRPRKYYVTSEEESRKSFSRWKNKERGERGGFQTSCRGNFCRREWKLFSSLSLSLSSFFSSSCSFFITYLPPSSSWSLFFSSRLEVAHEIKLVSSLGWEFHPATPDVHESRFFEMGSFHCDIICLSI